jgi:integrase
LAYRIKGNPKPRRISLGGTNDLSLEPARTRANEITTAARLGRDLIAEEAEAERARQTRISVGALIDLYVRRCVTGKLRTAKEIESRLRRALSPVVDLGADSLRRRDLRQLFDHAADQGYLREAEKRRQSVGAMFRWGIGQDLVEIDPTAGLSAYDSGTPRERVLSDDELRQLWAVLETIEFPDGHADIIRLQLLLGARCGEIGGMTAEEIDQDNWLWTLPAARSKNGRARVTPIVGRAKEILSARLLERPKGHLFMTETGRPIQASNIGNSIGVRREEIAISDLRTHDLRRTVATRMVENGGSLDMVAAVLGQEAGAKTTRTLVRHYVHSDFVERKRPLLEAWDRRLREIIDRNVTPNVIRLPASAERAA